MSSAKWQPFCFDISVLIHRFSHQDGCNITDDIYTLEHVLNMRLY